MKKITVLSGCMLLLILASCTQSDNISLLEETTVQTSTPVDVSITGTENTPVVLAQGFVEYDPSYIGETKDTVLFFHAEWCGSCKNTEASLIESGVPSELTVLKVDFDAPENLELRQKYWVTTKHTFVQVDSNGELVKKWEWSADLADIQENMEKTMTAWNEVMMDKSEDEVMIKEDAIMEKDEPQVWEIMEKKELSGIYADYDNSLIGSTDNTVLAFFASWCPSCVAADKGISAGEVPSDLSILKVDFDNSTDLRQKYGVVAQHTFVQIDADGNEIKKWVGWNSVEDVVERVQ